MGADSLALDWDNQPRGTPVCKVGIENDAVFVGTGFDVSWIAREALKSSGSLESRLGLFDQLARPVLQATFRQIIAEHKPAADHIAGTMMTFGAIEDGTPKVRVLNYYVSVEDQHLEPHFISCPGDCPTGSLTLLTGPDEDIEREHAERDLGVWSTAELFRRFIQRQIDRGRPTIGPPIDVVRLTRSGIDTKGLKPQCVGH